MAEKETSKSELSNIFPDFVDQSGKFALPTSDYSPEPAAEDRSELEDYVPAAAALGAGAVYAGSRAFPAVTQLVADERKIAGTQSRLDLIDRMISGRQDDLSQARAPYLAERSALTSGAEAARMELQRNQMLMEAVMKRAVEAGIDPRQFMESPETFVRASSPERGFGTKNYIGQEVRNMNPLIERTINRKGELMPAVEALQSTEPRAQQVVGSTVMRPSGLYAPEQFGSGSTRAGMAVSNVEQSLLRAMEESRRAQDALTNMPDQAPMRTEGDIDRLERQRMDAQLKLEDQVAQAARSRGMQPGVLERLGQMVSGPKMTAGLGALGGIELTQAYENFQKGEYQKALLNAMSGAGGAAMMSPFLPARAAGALMVGIPAAYEYGPKAFDLAKRGYESVFVPSKRTP